MSTTGGQGFETSGNGGGPWPVPDPQASGVPGAGGDSWPGLRLVIGLGVVLGLVIGAGQALGLLFDAHRVMSSSMEPTYGPGDRILSRPVSGGDVGRGDVVLVPLQGREDLPAGTSVVTRVVAIGGDTVEGRDGQLVVNGQTLPEDYLADGTATQNLEPETVPEGSVYVLGDNRRNSYDSRAHGPVPEDDVESVVILDWSLDRWVLGITAVLGIAFVAALIRMAVLPSRRAGRSAGATGATGTGA